MGEGRVALQAVVSGVQGDVIWAGRVGKYKPVTDIRHLELVSRKTLRYLNLELDLSFFFFLFESCNICDITFLMAIHSTGAHIQL